RRENTGVSDPRARTESASLLAPARMPPVGRLPPSPAPLMERRAVPAPLTGLPRPEPYQLLVELARGKINQVRNQAFEWRSIGLQVPQPLEDLLHAATAAFAEVVALAPEPAAQGRARAARHLGYQAAAARPAASVEHLLAPRLQREGRLTTLLGCRLPVLPPEGGRDAVRAACNAAVLPLTWRQIEPIESQYHWDEADAA